MICSLKKNPMVTMTITLNDDHDFDDDDGKEVLVLFREVPLSPLCFCGRGGGAGPPIFGGWRGGHHRLLRGGAATKHFVLLSFFDPHCSFASSLTPSPPTSYHACVALLVCLALKTIALT